MGLKPGAPRPRVRLPDNFVARPDAVEAVKEKLLGEHGQTLVVTAISGLGGLGKSVLAAVIVLDPDVQTRFAEGILWVTLGQNPDLPNLLGDWIRTLDKSRDSYSVTTLELARDYLHNLLLERRMLLVVDDVWNAAHTEWFRVGGPGCRVLVTTREARLEGAEYHELDLMSEDEAISLVRQKIGDCWQEEDEAEFKGFARALGYLPLALDLAANQVQDGLTWGELRQEFEVERRAVALELLDSTEAWENLPAEEQRKYSLRACFNLSLKRLKPEQLQQFAWLGVLPEDVTLTAAVAGVLWRVLPLQAKRGLIELRRRSFLTDGSVTAVGERTYRVHDLMHDTARGLIETGALAGVGDLLEAHAAFVDRYGPLDFKAKCCGLPRDGYIHRHLIWHLIQAGREKSVHELLAASDGAGRNAWFETCEEMGEPGIFVTAIAEGWKLAEGLYEQEPERAIVLQCRYALMTATLNSLVNQLSGELLGAFVKNGFWLVERAWAYAEQMQDERNFTKAVQVLAAYIPQPLFGVAVRAACELQDEYNRAKRLSALAQLDGADFAQLLEATRSIQNEYHRAEVLSTLAQLDGADFAQLLEAGRSIQDEYNRARILSTLPQLDRADFAQLLEAARSIQDEYHRVRVLSALAQLDGAYFDEALEAARSIQFESGRAEVLSTLAQLDGAYFYEALEAARLIQDEYSRAEVLSALAHLDSADFSQLLEAARSIQDEYHRARVLSALAQLDGAYFDEALEAARLIQLESGRAEVLSALAQLDGAYFDEVLKAARLIQDEYSRAEVLSALAQLDSADFSQLLEAARSIQDEYSRAKFLSTMAQFDSACFDEALEAARSIQDEYSRAKFLSILAQIDSAYFDEALEAARLIQSSSGRAKVLSALAQLDGAYFDEALEAARSIQHDSGRTEVLNALAQLDGADFPQLLEAARLIEDDYSSSIFSIGIAAHYSHGLTEIVNLEAPIFHRQIKHFAIFLSDVSKINQRFSEDAINMAYRITDNLDRTLILCEISYFYPKAIKLAVQSICTLQQKTHQLIALKGIVNNLPQESLDQFIGELLGCVEDGFLSGEIFSDLKQESAPVTKQDKPLLCREIQHIDSIPGSIERANQIHQLLPSLPLDILPFKRWTYILHLLAYHKRANLMQDLLTLAPAIIHLGGKDSLKGILSITREVCRQWP